VQTGRSGAAAKAGHDLLIEVGSWEATLELGDDPALALSVDAGSLRVLDGRGGMQALGEDDKANIRQTIADEVLKDTTIEFRSSQVRAEGGVYHVAGELELGGRRAPLAFDISLGADREVTATAAAKQSDWGIKPYSTLFGTLKVNDEVVVQMEGRLPPA
jgi:hypothetical protein